MKALKYYLVALTFILISISSDAQLFKKSRHLVNDTICINATSDKHELIFEFVTGKKHNHPSFAIWIESVNGEMIQPLFVTEAFGRGIYPYGAKESGNWKPGPRRYQATLPYFIHKWSNR